jgi:hypothetical protein
MAAAAGEGLSSFNKIKILYELNSEKIIMPEKQIGRYAINNDNLAYWQKMMNEYESRKRTKVQDGFYSLIAKIIALNIKYINFNEFYSRLKLLADDLLKKMITKKEFGYNYVFITAGKHDKSNTWCFLLLFGIIYKALIAEKMENLIYFNAINSPSERTKLEKIVADNPRLMFIYVDDMIYSGKQTSESLFFVSTTTQKTLTKTSITRDDIHFMAINYITNYAKEKLNNIHRVEYSPISIILPNILECILNYIPLDDIEDKIKKQLLELSIQKLEEVFENSKTRISFKHIPVYFDHKIADDVSTITDIFNFGYYPELIEREPDNSLINNCDKEYFRENSACINPYYKNIIYTIGDRNIMFESLDTLDITEADSLIKPKTPSQNKSKSKTDSQSSKKPEERRKLVLTKTIRAQNMPATNKSIRKQSQNKIK